MHAVCAGALHQRRVDGLFRSQVPSCITRHPKREPPSPPPALHPHKHGAARPVAGRHCTTHVALPPPAGARRVVFRLLPPHTHYLLALCCSLVAVDQCTLHCANLRSKRSPHRFTTMQRRRHLHRPQHRPTRLQRRDSTHTWTGLAVHIRQHQLLRKHPPCCAMRCSNASSSPTDTSAGAPRAPQPTSTCAAPCASSSASAGGWHAKKPPTGVVGGSRHALRAA